MTSAAGIIKQLKASDAFLRSQVGLVSVDQLAGSRIPIVTSLCSQIGALSNLDMAEATELN